LCRFSLRSYPDGPTTVRDRQRQADLAPKRRRERLKEGGELPKKREKEGKTFGGKSEFDDISTSQKFVVG